MTTIWQHVPPNFDFYPEIQKIEKHELSTKYLKVTLLKSLDN